MSTASKRCRTDNVIVAVEAKALQRNAGLLSMHSKSESIETQLEESAERTPKIVSRSQSAKSLIIEEEIADLTESESKTKAEVVEEFSEDTTDAGNEFGIPVKSMSSRSRSPAIAELKLLSRHNSMVKSMESLYDKRESETSSQASSGHHTVHSLNMSVNIPPIRERLHTPIKQKSKMSQYPTHISSKTGHQ